MDELRFDGRSVIVTGGGRGFGREHSLLLASRGARVVVADYGVEKCYEIGPGRVLAGLLKRIERRFPCDNVAA